MISDNKRSPDAAFKMDGALTDEMLNMMDDATSLAITPTMADSIPLRLPLLSNIGTVSMRRKLAKGATDNCMLLLGVM